MNILKVLVLSVFFPLSRYKQTVNAITFPILIYVLNLALLNEIPAISWLLFFIQIFALAMLASNCMAMVLNKTQPSIVQGIPVYLNVFGVFIIYMIVTTILSFILELVMFFVFPELGHSNASLVAQPLAKVFTFSILLMVPHYLFTGTKKFASLSVAIKASLLNILMLGVIMQVNSLLLNYLFISEISAFTFIVNSFLTFAYYTFGYFIVGFCYLGLIKDTENISV